MVDLGVPDENILDCIITHHVRLKSRPNDNIIADIASSVKPNATFISDYGETVVRKVRQVQKHLSEEEIDQIIIAYQAGKSANVLAREYGCDRKAICDHLKKHGVTVSRSKIRSEETAQQIIALYEANHLIAEIADRYDVSESAINRLLHANGVRVRSRWDYEKP